MSNDPPELLPLSYRSPKDDRIVRARLVPVEKAGQSAHALLGLAALCSPCLLGVGVLGVIFYRRWDFCMVSLVVTVVVITIYSVTVPRP